MNAPISVLPRARRASVVACLCVLLLASGQTAWAADIKPGDTLPIYLQAEALAEADRPKVDIAAFGASYWKPGPERLYGYALRDLRDYLQKVTGAQHPLTLAGPEKGGVFVGGCW